MAKVRRSVELLNSAELDLSIDSAELLAAKEEKVQRARLRLEEDVKVRDDLVTYYSRVVKESQEEVEQLTEELKLLRRRIREGNESSSSNSLDQLKGIDPETMKRLGEKEITTVRKLLTLSVQQLAQEFEVSEEQANLLLGQARDYQVRTSSSPWQES